MIQIDIPKTEAFDEIKQEFIGTKGMTVQLEHSLISLSKWEAKHEKPFLTKDPKTYDETIDYIRCMAVSNTTDPNFVYFLTEKHITEINKYIESPMTATWFSEDKNKSSRSREQITSELIYYWMIALNIPFECQKWHLNRLLTLVRVCNIKNQPPKNMSKKELLSRNAALNAARRKQLGSTG